MSTWTNFFVIVSTAAATLLGLLFVVITLAADRGLKDRAAIRIYLTPTVIYLTSVLLMSALLTIPTQTWLTDVISVCLVGIAGVAYSLSLAIRRGAYEQRSDLFPYVVFPFAAYALIVANGLLWLARSEISLNLVAGGMLLLLCIAIRNSWWIATTIVSSRD